MTEIMLVKVPGGFRPADPRAEDTLKGIRAGEIVKAQVSRPRNPQQHRLFWAFLTLVQQNTDRWPTPEALLQAIKIHLGHFDSVEMVDGRVVPHPRSISFGSMPQDDFRRFMNDAIDLVVTRIIPGLDRADLEREIFEMVGAR
jgi:hypothetical protein